MRLRVRCAEEVWVVIECMPKRKQLDLSSLDDKLLDGLKFCLKVYDLFDHVRAEPDGDRGAEDATSDSLQILPTGAGGCGRKPANKI